MGHAPLSKRVKDLLGVMGLAEDNPGEIGRVFIESRANFLRNKKFGRKTVAEIEVFLIHHGLVPVPEYIGYRRLIPRGFSDKVDRDLDERDGKDASDAVARAVNRVRRDLEKYEVQRRGLVEKIRIVDGKIERLRREFPNV